MCLRMALQALCFTLLASCAAGGPRPSAPAPSLNPASPAPMSPPALKAHIETLASDAFEGREPASPGEEKTLAYVTGAFAAAGLKPGVNGGWLQPTPLVQAELRGAPALTVAGADGAKAYAYKDQHVVFTRRMQAQVTLQNAPLVFVGYGIVAPEKGWNDYEGADIKGKIAVILVNDPDFDGAPHALFDGKAMTYYGRWTYKFEEAARQGAAGALVIHEPAPAAYPWAVVQSSWTGPQFDMVRPDRGGSRVAVEGWISTPMAADLFARARLDFADLKARAQQPGFKARAMNLKASVTLDLVFKETTSNNVLGIVQGAQAGEEVVLYMAHWDHLGRCGAVDGDDICNGALDNATGIAGLIELARAFAAGPPPRRTVAFLALTAEEQGLLGSAYYAEQPVFPLAKTVAALNMDGLPIFGPTLDVAVVGFGKSELEDVLRVEAAKQGRRVEQEAFPERGSYFRSDHFSLAKVGVPALFASGGVDLVSGGSARGKALEDDYVAKHYHKPADEFDPRWDLSGATQDLELLYGVGRTLADGDLWPNWRAGAEFRQIRDASRAQR